MPVVGIAPWDELEGMWSRLQPFLSVDNSAPSSSTPMVAPIIDLAAIGEAKRKAFGVSQLEAALMLGIKQPHWSNSIARRHDSLTPWGWNRVREFAADRVGA